MVDLSPPPTWLSAGQSTTPNRGTLAVWTDHRGRFIWSIQVDAIKSPELALLLAASYWGIKQIKYWLASPQEKSMTQLITGFENLQEAKNKDWTAISVWRHPFRDYDELFNIRKSEALKCIQQVAQHHQDQPNVQQFCQILHYAVSSDKTLPPSIRDEKIISQWMEDYQQDLTHLTNEFYTNIAKKNWQKAQMALAKTHEYFPEHLDSKLLQADYYRATNHFNAEEKTLVAARKQVGQEFKQISQIRGSVEAIDSATQVAKHQQSRVINMQIRHFFEEVQRATELNRTESIEKLLYFMEATVGIFPENTNYRRSLAESLVLSQRISDAVMQLDQICASSQVQSLDFLKLAQLQDQLGDKEAIHHYEKFRQRGYEGSDDALRQQVQKRLLMHYVGGEEFTKIKDLSAEAIRSAEHDPAFDFFNGYSLLKTGNNQAGILKLESLISHLGQQSNLNAQQSQLLEESYYELGVVYLKEPNVQKALIFIEAFQKNNPTALRGDLLSAEAHYQNKDIAIARKILQRISKHIVQDEQEIEIILKAKQNLSIINQQLISQAKLFLGDVIAAGALLWSHEALYDQNTSLITKGIAVTLDTTLSLASDFIAGYVLENNWLSYWDQLDQAERYNYVLGKACTFIFVTDRTLAAFKIHPLKESHREKAQVSISTVTAGYLIHDIVNTWKKKHVIALTSAACLVIPLVQLTEWATKTILGAEPENYAYHFTIESIQKTANYYSSRYLHLPGPWRIHKSGCGNCPTMDYR